MITEDEQESELEILAPPSWDEVEADEEYKTLSPMKKQMTLHNWTKAVNDYAKSTGEYDSDPESGKAVKDFFSKKYAELDKDMDLAVESGLYEDNLWGGAKRILDRATIGASQVAPNALSMANRLGELAVQTPEVMGSVLDSVGLNKISPSKSVQEKGFAQSYRDFSAPLREPMRQAADYYRNQSNEMSEAGAALGGGFVGEAAQAIVPAAAEAVQDMALAVGSGGASATQTLAKPMAAAMRSLNVSSVLSAVRSAIPTLDAAESQYMQEDPTLTREQARLKALPEALTSGASTALVTRLGGFTGVESVLLQGGPKALRGKVVEVLKEAASEGLEEATDQSLQDLSERFYRNPEKAWADTYKELAMAYSLGAVLGGGFSAVGQAVNSASQNAQDNSSPLTASVLRERVEKEAAIRTTQLFGDAESSAEADRLAAELLDELEDGDTADTSTEAAQNAYDEKSGQTFKPIGQGVISQDTTSTESEGQTTAPAPTLRESVLASGIPEEAADSYISNLQAEGLSDEQIQEIADNTRALREEAAKKNEADAEARREVARRARAGDADARAQLEQERGVNVTTPEPAVTTQDPAPQPQEPGRQFVDLGGPAPQFQGGTNQLSGRPEIPALQAPEVPQPISQQQPAEGGELQNEEERQGRTEVLNPLPTDSGAGAEGIEATPPPAEAPAPTSESPTLSTAEPEQQGTADTQLQGDRVAAATGAKGVISKKPLPVEEVQTGSDEEGRPVTRVVPRFVNDPDTLAESLHQNGGAERIYIPDEAIDNEEIDEDNIGFAFEKGTGRAYVTWARHSRYQDTPIMANGRTEDNATLEQLYQNDSKRQERSEAQTRGRGVELTENSTEFSAKIAEAPISDLEKNEPDTVQRELASIQRLASDLAEETVTTNSGELATIGPALADEIASAATNLYLARLRGVASGSFADAAGVVRDVKSKAVQALRSRGAGNVGVSLDQETGDGAGTVGDVVGDANAETPGETQAQLDERESQKTADAQVPQERPAPEDTSEALQFAMDMAVMELDDKDRVIWLEYKKRTTTKREGGKGAYRITNEQKRVAEMVKARANESFVEMLALERDVDETAGALAPVVEELLTESERAQMDRLNKLVEDGESKRIEARIRQQTAEVLKMGDGSVDVAAILKSLSTDKNQSELVRAVASWLVKSKHDFSNVKLELAANRNKRTTWAGLYSSGETANSGKIQINTAAAHRGGIGQTILHEAIHHIFLYKVRPSYKRNAVERSAYRDLMKILTHARRQLLMPEAGETLSQVARREFGADDTFYGLSNLDELITETLTNDRFFAWMSSQDAIPGLGTKGRFQTLWDQIKQVFKNFFAGVPVRPDSLLSQSLDNILALARDPQSDRKIRDYQNTVAERKRMVAESVRGNPKKLKGREMMEVLGNAVAEPSESPFMEEGDYDTAKELLVSQFRNPEIPINARGGVRVSLYSPDPSTARYLGIQDPIEARAIHLLTDERDRKTANPDKVRTAGQIVQTLRQADFVGYYDWTGAEGKVPMLVYAKLYKDPASPNGERWHFVEVRDLGERGILETQYSSTAPELGRALRSRVEWVGFAYRKNATQRGERDGGAGREQDLPGEDPQKYQDPLPDVSPTARENTDTTTAENVQQKVLEEIMALEEKRDRLIAQKSYEEAGQVDDQIRALNDRFFPKQAPSIPAAMEKAGQNTRTAKVEAMVQEAVGLIRTPVRPANLDGHPAQARMNENGELEIAYDPAALAIETEGLTDEESAATIRKLLGHENIHIAGMVNDYTTQDQQGRVGRAKIEAFHDEIMTDEMRQETADAYVRRFDGMSEEDYQAARQAFLANKVAVAGEYKRMFTERYLTGESYEDSLKALERKTGDKFGDIVRGIADYLIGRLRMLVSRYQLVRDPRLAAVILNDRRMLENLSTATGMLGDRVAAFDVEMRNASRVQVERLGDIRLDVRSTKPHYAGERIGGWTPKIKDGELQNIDSIPEDPTLRFIHNEGMMGSDIYTAKEFKEFLYSRKDNLRHFDRNSYSVVKVGEGLSPEQMDEVGVDARNASKAQIRRMKKNAAGWKASGWLGQGLMDLQVWKRIEQQSAELRGANYRVNETARKFNRLVKQHDPDPAVLQAALGSTDNTLTDAQYDQWKSLTKAAKKETDPVKRQAAMAAADNYRLSQVQANNTQRRADRRAALNQLPEELRDTVETMRRHIDNLSKTMISEGLVGANLQATLGANMEVYLNRSYEIFDNPEWSDFILSDQSPESQRIRNNAATLFRSQLVAEEARKIRRNARLNGQTVPTRQQALAAAQATVTDNDVSILMQDYLRVGDDAAVAILGGRLPGKKDTSIIKLRGQIPQEIRELWGEYKDTGVNYAKSYLKMANFIANHSFQKDFLGMGLTRSTPFLWKEGVSEGQRPPHWVEIYKGLSDSPNPNPMAGVYGPPIIVEAFQEMNEVYKQKPVMQWLAGLTGIAMASKTIYNPPQTYVRNFAGNGLIMFSQGYLLNDIEKLGFLQRLGKSVGAAGDRLVGAKRDKSDQVIDYIERLTELGVMGDNVKASVIKELTSVVFDRDPKNAFSEKLSKAFKMAKGANDRLVDAYSAGDDFWKILAFESERATFEKAYPEATPESIDRMAADRVRDVVPTYSMIPKVVKDIVKGQPYLAPYISWTSEILRTTLNTWKVGWQDATSGNPELQKAGLKRLGSAFVGQGLLVVAANTIRDLAKMDDEDEEALRRFLPDWQVNALIALTGKTDGKISFWDLSYLNPYDVLHEPFIAMANEFKQGGSVWDIAAAGTEKAMAPWTGEQLFFGALMDVARGYTKEGLPLYEKSDTKWNNFKKGADRVVSSLTPGAVNFSTRIYKAIQGEVSPGGKVYNLNDELTGALLGQKPAEVDLLQVFQNRKLGAFNRMLESANNLATKEYRTRGTADISKIKENYTQSNNARMEAFREISKDVEALEKMGIPRSKIFAAMATRGVGKEDINQIARGRYVRRFPGETSLENAVGLPNFQSRIRALREARDAYPEVQIIAEETGYGQ